MFFKGFRVLSRKHKTEIKSEVKLIQLSDNMKFPFKEGAGKLTHKEVIYKGSASPWTRLVIGCG